LWVYAALIVFSSVLLVVSVHGPVAARVFFVALMAAWLYMLLKGVRWVWIATLVITALGLLIDAMSGVASWRGGISTLIALGLLVLPVTRQYFSGKALPRTP
jgi:hypothetical protein